MSETEQKSIKQKADPCIYAIIGFWAFLFLTSLVTPYLWPNHTNTMHGLGNIGIVLIVVTYLSYRFFLPRNGKLKDKGWPRLFVSFAVAIAAVAVLHLLFITYLTYKFNSL